MSEKIKCELCGGYYKSLLGHLPQRHGIGSQEYMVMFPDSPYESSDLAERRSKSATRINTGRRLSGVSKQKISKSLIARSGGDEGNSPYSRSWYRKHDNPKRRALERDGYKCQGEDCRGVSSRLLVHHKDEDTHNNDLSNLVTLCSSCHAREHGIAPSNDIRDKGKSKRIAQLQSPEIRRKMSETMKRRWRERRAAGLPWGKQPEE